MYFVITFNLFSITNLFIDITINFIPYTNLFINYFQDLLYIYSNIYKYTCNYLTMI